MDKMDALMKRVRNYFVYGVDKEAIIAVMVAEGYTESDVMYAWVAANMMEKSTGDKS